mgnify:CR=1 FL=1
MDKFYWIQQEIERLCQESTDYKERAFYLGLNELLAKQEKRKEQIQGRLDGELWSPGEWEK